ncbi:uncharacterized protein ASCRUDRAFT_15039 [Ascoidea rubescens DSM 1968]|uniref:Elongation factor 1 alpha-like protein n=1 Tax=Ascoidea rubescens DSM 1968 TaxID=1344418 RepID=A0A1D2VC52_9ASCO|nr:hypothetical protein ASCRUDRAFT_15039 [Ascoidea rubescens DSM 1968]ODV59284.1 hypothetical protein ASCRUDRAFT_15039 [Ascoidea rubescens DSM 1968]
MVKKINYDYESDYTYSDDGDYYDPNNLTEEEEVRLLSLVPLVKRKLTNCKGYNDQDIEESLYFHNLDVIKAADELIAKFRQITIDPQSTTTSKLSSLSKLRKKSSLNRSLNNLMRNTLNRSSEEQPSATPQIDLTNNTTMIKPAINRPTIRKPLNTRSLTPLTPRRRPTKSLNSISILDNLSFLKDANTNTNTTNDNSNDFPQIKTSPLKNNILSNQPAPKKTISKLASLRQARNKNKNSLIPAAKPTITPSIIQKTNNEKLQTELNQKELNDSPIKKHEIIKNNKITKNFKQPDNLKNLKDFNSYLQSSEPQVVFNLNIDFNQNFNKIDNANSLLYNINHNKDNSKDNSKDNNKDNTEINKHGYSNLLKKTSVNSIFNLKQIQNKNHTSNPDLNLILTKYSNYLNSIDLSSIPNYTNKISFLENKKNSKAKSQKVSKISNLKTANKTTTLNKQSIFPSQNQNQNQLSSNSEENQIGKQIENQTEKIVIKGFKNSVITSPTTNLKTSFKTTKPYKKLDLSQIIKLENLKKTLTFAVIGHIDAGKSTLMGRLLYDMGYVDQKLLYRLTKESSAIGKGSFALAWIMDQNTDERKRGVTIDYGTSNFQTADTNFIMIDAPGHKDFIPNMINGTSQADVAVLMIDASTGAFESGFTFDGQTRDHTVLARNLGITRLIVAINKLDTIDFDQHRFNDIKDQLLEFFIDKAGYEKQNITFIPVSGLNGDNVFKKSTNRSLFKWYPKKEPTLVEALENEAVVLNNRFVSLDLTKEAFAFAINDIDTSKHGDDINLTGKVMSGCIQIGESVLVQPSNFCLRVNSIKSWVVQPDGSSKVEEKEFVIKNDNNITLLIKHKELKVILCSQTLTDIIKFGDLITKIDKKGINRVQKNKPLAVSAVKKFKMKLKLYNLENKPLLVGAPFMLFRGSASVPASIEKIKEISGAQKKKNSLHLVSGQNAVVTVKVEGDRELSLMKFADNHKLGRLVLIQNGYIIGVGLVEKFLF